MTDADGELLVVLFDTNLLRLDSAAAAPADTVLQQLLLFFKAHQLLSENNHQCLIAMQPNSSPVVFTPSSRAGSAAALPQLVLQRMQQLVAIPAAPDQQQQQQQSQPQEVALAAGLSRALCYINRHLGRYGANSRRKAKPRVLSLLLAADTPLQYIPVMNCIFAAQHADIVLDACVVGSADSAFLQQAAHITGGVYLKAQQPAGLLQYLLGAFSADTATRGMLSIGSGVQSVDYRASCFCHKNVIDTGYICSVCLSIFCKANMRLPQCPTCGSEFKQKAAGGAAAGGGRGAAAAGARGGGRGGPAAARGGRGHGQQQ